MIKSTMLALATAGALVCTADANAGGHVSWSIGINAPAVGAVVSSGPVYGYPAYGYPVYESYPAYPVYAPAPVYVQPAPVYYRQAPVIYGPPAYYHRHHRHVYRPAVPAPYPRHWR